MYLVTRHLGVRTYVRIYVHCVRSIKPQRSWKTAVKGRAGEEGKRKYQRVCEKNEGKKRYQSRRPFWDCAQGEGSSRQNKGAWACPYHVSAVSPLPPRTALDEALDEAQEREQKSACVPGEVGRRKAYLLWWSCLARVQSKVQYIVQCTYLCLPSLSQAEAMSVRSKYHPMR